MKYRQTPNVSNYKTNKIGFVIHGTLGSYLGAVEWLCTPANKRPVVSYSSAHYVISKKGEVTQLAGNDQVTWHAGVIYNPTWRARKFLPTVSGVPFVAPFKNPNDSFVGIELEWFQGDVVTEKQYEAVTKIIKDSGIVKPVILSHKEMTSHKADFENIDKTINMFPVQEILRRIQ